jgi:steroid delta-isomerase-like uncharacterized protein
VTPPGTPGGAGAGTPGGAGAGTPGGASSPGAIPPPAREAIVREIEAHLRAESSQDLDALLAGMTEDCYNFVACDPSPMYQGPEAVARRYKGLWAALPDLDVRLRRVVAIEGASVVTEHRLSGTHLGPLFGVEATGRRLEVDTCVVWEFVGERVRGETVYFDLATMLRQAGALTLGR